MYNFYYFCIMTPHKKQYSNMFYYYDLETGYFHGLWNDFLRINLYTNLYSIGGIGYYYKEKQKGFWLTIKK